MIIPNGFDNDLLDTSTSVCVCVPSTKRDKNETGGK